jgi:hypothetical protein
MISNLRVLRFPTLFAVGFAVALSVACASGGLQTGPSGTGVACAVLDSSYGRSGFVDPLTFVGKATIDANQYRVRGVVRVETQPPNNVYLEFNSSLLFGNRIEDFFCSVVDDTLRIVDRERGRYFEGEVAEQFLRDQLSMDFSIQRTLSLILGGHPACENVDELNAKSGGSSLTGRTGGRPFMVKFLPDGRVDEVVWPVPDDPAIKDQVRVEYDWGEAGSAGLKRMTIHLEEREWRCKLSATTD